MILTEEANSPKTVPKAKPDIVPPIEKWVPSSIRALLLHAPTNPALKGLIRNLLHLVMPDDLKTTDSITEFLVTHFKESRPFKEGRIQKEPVLPGVQVTESHLILEAAAIRGNERGTANFRCELMFDGPLRIPSAIYRQGWAPMMQWLHRGIANGSIAITMNSDNYEYIDHASDGVDLTLLSFTPDQLQSIITGNP